MDYGEKSSSNDENNAPEHNNAETSTGLTVSNKPSPLQQVGAAGNHISISFPLTEAQTFLTPPNSQDDKTPNDLAQPHYTKPGKRGRRKTQRNDVDTGEFDVQCMLCPNTSKQVNHIIFRAILCVVYKLKVYISIMRRENNVFIVIAESDNGPRAK